MRLTVRFQLASIVLASALAAGCGGEDRQVPAATTETQASRQPNQPTTVTGCLRAGEAADTYVLTTAATAGESSAATYHLTGTDRNVNFRDHIGTRVQVSGTVEAQSQIVARESARPADNATGTAGTPGTPTVQSGTQLSAQRLDVKSIKPTGEECGGP